MITRLRVGGATLAVRAAAPTPALALPERYRPFIPSQGQDIALRLVPGPVPPVSASTLLFESGGTWRVHRQGRGLLYVFRPPQGDGPPARAAAVDRFRRRGILYLPPSPARRGRGFALSYPLDELLFQHHLALAGGLVLHACGVVIAGRALLLCGPSGVGKTTLARLVRRARPAATVLSDDRIVVRRAHRGWRAHGTPWHGSGRFASPRTARVAAIVFLEQSRKPELLPIPVADAVLRLFAHSFPPLWESQGVAASLASAGRLAASVPGYLLRFLPDRSAIELLEKALAHPPGSHGEKRPGKARRLLR